MQRSHTPMAIGFGVVVVSFTLPWTIWPLGCSRRPDGLEIRRAPEGERAPREQSMTADAAAPPERVISLIGHLGDQVAVEGILGPGVFEHVARAVPGKFQVYVTTQVPNELVAYVAAQPTCPREVRMSGKVVVTAGLLPRTGAAYAELQLDVDRWSCAGAVERRDAD